MSFNLNNWVTVTQVINTVNKFNWKGYNHIVNLTEFTKLTKEDSIYILEEKAHLFTILHLCTEKICYISDGNNTFIDNKAVNEAIRQRIGNTVRCDGVRNDLQIKVDHCGSCAAMLAIIFKSYVKRRSVPSFVVIPKRIRKQVRNILHPEISNPMEEQPQKAKINNLKRTRCPYCDKTFGWDSRRLSAHIYQQHPSMSQEWKRACTTSFPSSTD